MQFPTPSDDINGNAIQIVKEPNSQIDSIDLNQTSELLAVSLSNIFADTWSGKLKVFRAHEDRVYTEMESIELIGGNSASVMFLKSLKAKAPELLLSASDSGDIYIWNCEENGSNLSGIKYFAAHESIVSGLYPCNIRALSYYSSSYDSSVKFWSEDKLVRKFQGHNGPVTCVTCCDGNTTHVNLLLSGGFDNSAFMWDIRTSEPVACFGSEAHINALDWNSDINENLITIGDGDGQVSIYDIRIPFKALWEMEKQNGNVNSLISFYNNNNKQATYAVGSDDTTCTIISGDVKINTNDNVNSLNNDDNDGMFSNDGNLILPCTFTRVSTFKINDHTDYVRAIKWNKQKNILLTGGWDGNLYSYKL